MQRPHPVTLALTISLLGISCLIPVGIVFAKPAKTKPKTSVKTQKPPKSTDEAIVPAQEATSQKDAIAKARDVDLPALELADEVTIEPIAKASKFVTITKPAAVAELRKSLFAGDAVPTVGENKFAVIFLSKKRLVRKIVLKDNGDWALSRPGTSYNCGHSEKFLKLVESKFK